MTALITGSMAYDTIMVFQGHFKEHILPDKVHMLNVSFLTPQMRREFGGCAGNIAYNLNLLGGKGYPMGTVGEDFAPYQRWLDDNNIDNRYIREIPGVFTGQAFITTDLDDNQITAFHPGAMGHAHEAKVPTNDGITIGIVSPDGPDGMREHSEQFAAANIPFIYDPGQQLPTLDGKALNYFIGLADWVAANDYEAELIQERTGLSPHEIAEKTKAYIVTRGGEGSYIYAGGQRFDIPAAPISGIVDPTGCGDAFRAGLLFGLMNNLSWDTTGRIAALAAAFKIEHAGTQNHRYTFEEFEQRYHVAFGEKLELA